MNDAIRKIHIYAGLLSFTQLAIYGVAGLVAAFHGGGERAKAPQSVTYVPFAAPPGATDKEVAALVYAALNPSLARPMPDWFLQRSPDHHLLLDFYNINGIHRVVVLEEEHRLRVEEIRNSAWLFLEDIHASTPGDADAPGLVRAWAWWNELGMWALPMFCVSGMWLWISSRPRYVWAWAALSAGAVSLAVLWRSFR